MLSITCEIPEGFGAAEIAIRRDRKAFGGEDAQQEGR